MKIRDTYLEGQSGEPLRRPNSRMHRIAHRLGQASGRSIEKQNAALDAAHVRTFEAALEAAKGPNKTALEIIKAAAAIPHQGSSEPLWGTGETDPSVRMSDGYHKVIAKKWYASFVHVPSTTAESRADHAIPVTRNLGHLRMDSLYWNDHPFFIGNSRTPDNEIRVPVDNLSVSVNAPLNDNGVPQPASTRIRLNARQYHAGNEYSTREERQRDYQREFAEKLTFCIDAEGNLTELLVSKENASGMVKLDTERAVLGVEDFLQEVLASVQDTAAAYQGIPTGIDTE